MFNSINKSFGNYLDVFQCLVSNSLIKSIFLKGRLTYTNERNEERKSYPLRIKTLSSSKLLYYHGFISSRPWFM